MVFLECLVLCRSMASLLHRSLWLFARAQLVPPHLSHCPQREPRQLAQVQPWILVHVMSEVA